MHNPTSEQVAALPPNERKLVEDAVKAGVSDRRNSYAYVRAMLARVAWLNANAAKTEQKRKERLESDSRRLTRLQRAAEKRRRKGARKAAEAYAL